MIEGQLLMPIEAQGLVAQFGRVVVRDGLIEHVYEGDSGPRADFGSPEHFVTPGFVDTHVHLPQFDSIGVDGLELMDWLAAAVFPAEAKWADESYAADMTRRVARQLLSFGTTTVAAYATSHHASTQAAIHGLAEAGLSGCVGQVLMDQNAPAELLVPASESLASARRLRARGRVEPAVTPRFAVSCSRELLEGAGKLAEETECIVHTDSGESV